MISADATAATLHRDEDGARYLLTLDGTDIGLIDYVRRGDVLDFHHTEVAPAYEGHGFGTRLVALALADVRERGLQVRPTCSFVRAYVRRHPDLAEVVAA